MPETYAHMCRDEHPPIGHNDSTQERCPVCRERDLAEVLYDALREILETSKHFYTQTAGIDDYKPMFLPPELTPYAGPLAMIFKAANEAVKNYEAGHDCACHLGSVCTPACEAGQHHEGCTKGQVLELERMDER